VARSEARLSVEIWEDSDFLKLSPLAQRAYMFLISQPDLAHDGVIPLRERRWARKSAGQDPDALADNLRELDDSRFLVIDWDTEEVLIRSFIRRDRVFKQPNVLRAAVDHIPLVESKAILRALIAEMARIREENPSLTVEQDKVLHELEDALAKRVGPESVTSPEMSSADPSGNPSEKGSDIPSEKATAKSSRGTGSVTAVPTDSPFPDSPLVPLPAGDVSPPRGQLALVEDPEPEPQTTQQLVAWWIERCTQRPAKTVIGQMSKQIKELVEQGFQPAHIRLGIGEWAAKEAHPSVLASIVTAVANRGAPIRAAPRRSTTDDRVNAALAVGAEFRAEAQKAIDP
jgi:hypothetical protein